MEKSRGNFNRRYLLLKSANKVGGSFEEFSEAQLPGDKETQPMKKFRSVYFLLENTIPSPVSV